MVRFRWLFVVMPTGELCLVSLADYLCKEVTPFPNPLFSVAREVVGFAPRSETDVGRAARSIELPNDFAILVFHASLGEKGLSTRAIAVREELIATLCPAKLYEPDLNSLRVPLL